MPINRVNFSRPSNSGRGGNPNQEKIKSHIYDEPRAKIRQIVDDKILPLQQFDKQALWGSDSGWTHEGVGCTSIGARYGDIGSYHQGVLLLRRSRRADEDYLTGDERDLWLSLGLNFRHYSRARWLAVRHYFIAERKSQGVGQTSDRSRVHERRSDFQGEHQGINGSQPVEQYQSPGNWVEANTERSPTRDQTEVVRHREEGHIWRVHSKGGDDWEVRG